MVWRRQKWICSKTRELLELRHYQRYFDSAFIIRLLRLLCVTFRILITIENIATFELLCCGVDWLCLLIPSQQSCVYRNEEKNGLEAVEMNLI